MTSDVVHVEIPGNRDDVLKILKRTGISGVPVIKNKKIVGIITRKDLLRKPEETQLGLLMTAKPITIESGHGDPRCGPSPCREADPPASGCRGRPPRRPPLGCRYHPRPCPDQEQGRDQGEVYQQDVCPLGRDPLPVVGRVMEISGVDAIPILDAENKLQGIISERDLIRNSSIEDSVGVSDFSNGTDDDEWTWESIRDNHTISFGISKVQLPNRPVKLAMVKNVVAVPQNAEVSECALKMKPLPRRPAAGHQRRQETGRHALRPRTHPGLLQRRVVNNNLFISYII